MESYIDIELGIRLIISFLLGAAIGLEREYHSKAAGLRTMIMICLGSTIFTEISIILGGSNPDRIAANIVTGVGFLGAGVIFKDGLSVSGITTATTIWISAAMGMAVGAGQYFIAVVSTGVIIIVLSLFNKIQRFVEKLHQVRTYKVSIAINAENILEPEMKELALNYVHKKSSKDNNTLNLFYEVVGSEKQLNSLTEFLRKNEKVIAFEH
jgi:putative Mg2+ transporter-C (MgtC) family protein